MRLKVSYEEMDIKPNDTVVVRPTYFISADEAKQLYKISKDAFPNNNVVVILNDITIKNYNKAEFF